MREIDALALPAGDFLDADICIAGGGAAGLAIACELADSPQRVVLLESGIQNTRCDATPQEGRVPRGSKRYHDPLVQPMYAGEAAGLLARIDEDFALRSRNRCLGGSTNCWDGWLCPLDPADFQPISGWPTGWPIAYDDLVPFYRRALSMCGVQADGLALFEAPDGERLGVTSDAWRQLRVDPAQLVILDPSDDLGFDRRFRERLRRAQNITVLRNANVVGFRGRSRIDAADVACIDPLSGSPARRLLVRSDSYVLATGGIENVRLLEVSGLGGAAWCGAGFMCHPMYANAVSFVAGDGVDARLRHFFSTRAAARADRERYSVRGALVSARRGRRDDDEAAFRALVFLDASADGRGYASVDWEQRPDPENRVELTASRDALGLPTVRITWNLRDADRCTLRQALQRLARCIGEIADARAVCTLPIDGDEWPLRDLDDEPLYAGEHHMGATRMAAESSNGVVDPQCCVFGVENLFVTGSSVFPRAGHANPTLTILALAIRLANHLKLRTARTPIVIAADGAM